MGVLTRSPRRRRRRDRPRASQTFVVGLIIVAVFAGLGFLMLRLYNGLPGRGYEKFYVSIPTVGNLLSHDFVRISGVRVGQVLKIDVAPDGRPRVELQLDPGTKLPVGTTARLRANGLLGARYVEVVPGTSSQLLPYGATIKADETAYTYGVPEFVDVFNRDARSGLDNMIGGLGAGLAGNGAGLNNTLRIAAVRTKEFDRLARTILARDGAAARFAPSLESGFAALDNVTYYVRPFTQAAGDAVQPFVTEREAVHSTLERAPAALRSARAGLSRGHKLMRSVRQLSTAAAETLPPAPAGLQQLSELMREADTPLDNVRPVLQLLETSTADEIKLVFMALGDLGQRVEPGLKDAKPIVDWLGRYGCDVVNAGAVLRSMTGFAQAPGGPGGSGYVGPGGKAMAFRIDPVPGGLDTLGVPGDPSAPVRRDGYERPCRYISREYDQFLGPHPEQNRVTPDSLEESEKGKPGGKRKSKDGKNKRRKRRSRD